MFHVFCLEFNGPLLLNRTSSLKECLILFNNSIQSNPRGFLMGQDWRVKWRCLRGCSAPFWITVLGETWLKWLIQHCKFLKSHNIKKTGNLVFKDVRFHKNQRRFHNSGASQMIHSFIWKARTSIFVLKMLQARHFRYTGSKCPFQSMSKECREEKKHLSDHS